MTDHTRPNMRVLAGRISFAVLRNESLTPYTLTIRLTILFHLKLPFEAITTCDAIKEAWQPSYDRPVSAKVLHISTERNVASIRERHIYRS
jgi:hypothetical protein